MTEKLFWDVYIHHPNWKVRFDIAESPKTPLWVLEQMVNDDDCFVLLALCSNSKTTTEMLDDLITISANTERPSMRGSIIRNQKLSERSYLKILAIDKFKKILLQPFI